jgi:hypothetical protein
MGSVTSAIFVYVYIFIGARGSVVGWGTALQAGRSRVQFSMRSLDFSIDLILPAVLWPRDRLDLSQKCARIFLEVKGGQRIKLTTSPPSVSWLFRENVAASSSYTPMGLHGLLQGQLELLCFYSQHQFNTTEIRGCNRQRIINRLFVVWEQ